MKLWPFGKKSSNSSSHQEEHKKCDGCGKAVKASECTKGADGKCLCKDCHAKNSQ